MYGYDEEQLWHDYDLKSAYTTVMSIMAEPDLKRARSLTEKELNTMLHEEEVINSFIIMKGSFEFSMDVKYPSIPVSVDKDTTIFPLEGDCILTGAEYVLAINQGCKIKLDSIYYIPFKKGGYKPFYRVIDELQSMRRKYDGTHPMNTFLKLIANAIYGIVCKGFGGKSAYDIKTGSYVKIKGGELSNPIIAS
jgi:hypothetical protein